MRPKVCSLQGGPQRALKAGSVLWRITAEAPDHVVVQIESSSLNRAIRLALGDVLHRAGVVSSEAFEPFQPHAIYTQASMLLNCYISSTNMLRDLRRGQRARSGFV